MVLSFIGIGLNDEKDISLKGLETVRKCSKVYLESYTSKLGCSVGKIKAIFKRLFSNQIKIFNFSFILNRLKDVQLLNYNFSLRNLKLFTITSLFEFW